MQGIEELGHGLEPPDPEHLLLQGPDEPFKAYRKDGIAGLFPKRRQDREKPRRNGLEIWISYSLRLLYEQPDRSLTQLELTLQMEFVDLGMPGRRLSVVGVTDLPPEVPWATMAQT